MNIKDIYKYLIAIVAVAAIGFCVFSDKLFFRLDLTQEKRYSISDNTKNMLKNADGDISVVVYLDGDLNAGFLRLRKATKEMLDEFNVYAGGGFSYKFVNPSAADNAKARDKQYEELEKRGLRRIPVYDKDAEGNPTMKVVFPWAEITYKETSGKKVTRPVCLLKNVQGKSGEENLNLSEQSLEYELTNVLRLLVDKRDTRVAFLEGHGEWPEQYVYDFTKTLSEYYSIDFGAINNRTDELDAYAAVIVAGPTSALPEKDKYVLDQYIMNGGKVLWLVDAVKISLDSLSKESQTIGIVNTVNLDDQLFRYGVRINPVLLQDVQCSMIPVNMAREGDTPDFKPAPWYYSPLLITNPYHTISKNVTPVKTEFVSSMDFVGDTTKIVKTPLLLTSSSTHVQTIPSIVSMDIINVEKTGYYFNIRNMMTAALLEGQFTSIFKNRMAPEGIKVTSPAKTESQPTKMIVVADADVIRNDVQGYGANAQVLPLGYDQYMNQQFGNSDFLLNCVNYLTDDDGWMQLRNREVKLRLLNKASSIGARQFWQILNVLLPVLLLGIFAAIYLYTRKRKYTH